MVLTSRGRCLVSIRPRIAWVNQLFGKLATVFGAVLLLGSLQAQEIPLGPIGGSGTPVWGTPMIRITSLDSGGPGENAGLQVGDHIVAAEGRQLSTSSTDSNDGYQGAVQDLASAIDRVGGDDGLLNLSVVRSGSGGLDLTVNIGTPGSLGIAWPAASPKTSAIFDSCCDEIHSRVSSSSSGNFGYNSGWFGIILLSHPDWNSSSGARPYRLSIDKLRTRCENYLNGRILEPAEAFFWNGSDTVANPAYSNSGLENWDICSSAIFLAEYRLKTGDTSADAVVQRAAEMIAHRIQSWNQYDDPGAPHVLGGGLGRMGHGGVHGDYSHYNGIGALNIINAHALPALALLRDAGANVNLNLGSSINSFGYDVYNLNPTIEEKFRICWDWCKQATNTGGGGDDGNVGYVGPQGGYDSSGRTGGVFAGWHMYGLTANADDTDKLQRQHDYIARRWYRQQHAHAYTLGGVVLSQFAIPFMDDREQRYFQENSRLYPSLAQRPDGSIAYFPGRQNNGGDGYLNFSRVALINTAMPMAIRSGNLPGFPTPNPDRIHAEMLSPVNSWPLLEARHAKLEGGLSHDLDLQISDVDGTPMTSGYTATWSQISGPGAVGFSTTSSEDTTVSFPQDGTYRVQLELDTGSYTLTELYDLEVEGSPPSGGVAPFLVVQPEGVTVEQGESFTLTVSAQGSAPLLYEWFLDGQSVSPPSSEPSLTIESAAAGSAGDYICIVSNAYGSVSSQSASVTIEGIGSFHWGGLWQDLFYGISGNTVANLTGSANFPNFPDAGAPIFGAESQVDFADSYGQRWSGWITPPETGNYTFYIASDDESQLWLSTDATRANRNLIANKFGWTGSRNWSGAGTSAPIPLVGGQRYYIEILHKEGGGGDNCAVTWNWQSPGVWATPANGSAPLPGAILEYQNGGTLDDLVTPPANYPPTATDFSASVFGGVPTNITLEGEDFETPPGGLTFTVTSQPSLGSLSGTAPNLVYTPNPGASGTDTFTFIVNDGSQDSLEGTVTIGLIPESGAGLKEWTGASDALWTTAGNWSGASGTPGSAEAAFFDAQSIANLTLSLNGDQTVNRLVIGDPFGPITINDNTLTLNDGISLLGATNDLTLGSALVPANAQEWWVDAGRTLTSTGGLNGSQPITKRGDGLLIIQNPGSNSGGIIVDAGTLELRGGGWYQGSVGGGGTLTVNAGATAINRNAHSFGSSNSPNRDLVVNQGNFLLQGETYVDDVTLTAGRVANTPGASGNLRAATGNKTDLTVNPSDDPSEFATPFALFGNAIFDIADGAAASDLLFSGPLQGGATLTKEGDGRLVLSGLSTHTGTINHDLGSIVLTGTLNASSTLNVSGLSTFEGTGVHLGTVNNSGLVQPGWDGIAILTIGEYVQNPDGNATLELNGTNPGSGHDQINVTGNASLGGILNITLGGSYTPTAGDQFDVVVYGTRSGTFSTIDLPNLPFGLQWATEYDPAGLNGLRLTIEATPNSAPLVEITSPASSPNAVAPGNSLQLTASASDDGLPAVPGSLSLSWTTDSGPASAVFSSPSSATTSVTFPVAGTYTLRLTADDGDLSSSASTVIEVGGTPSGNAAPVVDAGPDSSFVISGLLSGSVSDDGLPNPPAAFTSQWTQVSGPAIAVFDDPADPASAVSFPVSGSYVLRLTASDGAVEVYDEVTATATAPANFAIWTGATDSLWSSGGNWFGGATPALSDEVIFNWQSQANLGSSLGGGFNVQAIRVLDPPAPASISGGTLGLSNGINLGNATQNLTINSALAVQDNQTWTTAAGRTLTINGSMSGTDAINLNGSGTIAFTTPSPFSGALAINGGSVELLGGGLNNGYVGGSGNVTVQAGALLINRSAQAFGNRATSNRDLNLNGGEFRLDADTYFDDLTLTNGLVSTASGASLLTRTDGGSRIDVGAASPGSSIQSNLTIGGATTLDLVAGARLAISGNMDGSAPLTKGGAGTLLLQGTNSHSGNLIAQEGTLLVNGSTGAASELSIQSFATLGGEGAIDGSVNLAGLVSPGEDSIASLNLGSLTQQPGSRILIELEGTSAGDEHDQVVIAGTASLDGTLDVELAPAYEPVDGDQFTLLTCGTRDGEFATINLPAVDPGLQWITEYDPDGTPGLRITLTSNTAPTLAIDSPASSPTAIAPGASLLLAATASDDGQPVSPGSLSFQWSTESGPASANFASPAAEDTSVSFPTSGVYTLTLTASDGQLDTSASLVIEVGGTPSGNSAPVVDAGPDASFGISGALAGSVSDDGLPDPPAATSISWSQVSGPSGVVFQDPGDPATLVSFPSSGTYLLRLKASDGSVTVFDEMTATVSTSGPLAVWTGDTSALWSIGSNWVGGGPPQTLDTVVFNWRSSANLLTELTANQLIEGLRIDDPAAEVSISRNELSLMSGIDMSNATQDLVIASNLGIGAEQTWTLSSGRTLSILGAIGGTDPLSLDGDGTFVFSGTGTFSGPVTLNGGTLELSGGGWYQGYVGGDGTLTANPGTTVINRVAHEFGNENNSNRSLVLNEATFVADEETYIRNLDLTASLISMGPGDTDENIRPVSSGASVFTVNPAPVASEISAMIEMTGELQLNVANGAAPTDLLISAPVNGTANLNQAGPGTVRLTAVNTHTGAWNLNEGRLFVMGSTTAGSNLTVSNIATLAGEGSIGGLVSSSGRVEPGDEGTGILTVGDFSQDASGTLAIELDGTTADSDQLVVTGTATLDGTLEVTLASGYTPTAGDSFDLLTATTRNGGFATLNLPALSGGLQWQSEYDAGGSPGLRLTVSANSAPLVTIDSPASSPTAVDSGLTLLLEATVTDDGQPGPPASLQLTWSTLSGPASAQFADSTSEDTSVNFPAAGTYELQLSASDGELVSTAAVVIEAGIAASANAAPLVDAGSDQTSGLSGSLAGTVGDDGLPASPGTVTSTWSQVSGPAPAVFADSGLPGSGIQFPQTGSYLLRLTAGDGSATVFDEVTFTVVGPYDLWASGHFDPSDTDPTIIGPDADPDQDGLDNLMEYALNLDPMSAVLPAGTPGHSGLPAVELTAGGDLRFIYRRNKAATDLTFSIMESDDLGLNDTWAPAAVSENILSDDGFTEVIEATLTTPPSGDRKFLHLSVTIAP